CLVGQWLLAGWPITVGWLINNRCLALGQASQESKQLDGILYGLSLFSGFKAAAQVLELLNYPFNFCLLSVFVNKQSAFDQAPALVGDAELAIYFTAVVLRCLDTYA
ncbi:unnamed protein product, partial [marine sediment metagenome]